MMSGTLNIKSMWMAGRLDNVQVVGYTKTMGIMGISDNMFFSPSVSVSSRGTYFLQGKTIIASENTIKSIGFCC